MHTLDNLDDYAVGVATGQRLHPPEWRWDLWQGRPDERPKPDDEFPTTRAMLARLHEIREAAMGALASADDARMSERVVRHPRKTVLADFYVRTICHANSHVRQIWLLRGLQGLGEPNSWPQQHWS
jgi:hypothetical protein